MDRSEAKKEYKQAKRPMGVYRIINKQNNKSYVGYSIDLQARIIKPAIKQAKFRHPGLDPGSSIYTGFRLSPERQDMVRIIARLIIGRKPN